MVMRRTEISHFDVDKWPNQSVGSTFIFNCCLFSLLNINHKTRASPSVCQVWEERFDEERSTQGCSQIHYLCLPKLVAACIWLWGKSLQVEDQWQPFIPQLSVSESGQDARVCRWWLVMPPASLFFLQLEIRERALPERANLDAFPLYYNVPSTVLSGCLSMGWWIEG